MLNVIRIVTLSRQNTELSLAIERDRSEAERLTADAARIRQGINKDELELVVDAAQEANALIDQRTFSWTEFFNQHRIDAAAGRDAHVGAAAVEDGVTSVTMSSLGRRVEDIDEFMEKLEATGAFDERPAARRTSTSRAD